MIIQTHHHLATLIHQHVQSQFSLKLDDDRLHLGSIMPDINWKYMQIPHNFSEGFTFYTEEIAELLRIGEMMDLKEFSKKLGIVLHFTADFFCQAHNDEELKANIWNHLHYEVRLHNSFMNYRPGQQYFYSSSQNPLAVIMNLRKRYLEAKPSLENDLTYIYLACTTLTDMIVEKVLLPQVVAA